MAPVCTARCRLPLAIMAACVLLVCASASHDSAAIRRLERNMDILNMDVMDLRVNLRGEKQLREQLETKLSEYGIRASDPSNNEESSAVSRLTGAEQRELISELDNVKAALENEHLKNIELEATVVQLEAKVGTLQSESATVTAMQKLETKLESVQLTSLRDMLHLKARVDISESKSVNVNTMLRRALGVEKRHRHTLEKDTKRIGESTKRLGESQTHFESIVSDALTNVRETASSEKQANAQSLIEWADVVTRLEQGSANLTHSVCGVAGDQAERCVEQKSEQIGKWLYYE
jgi:hypothetical protein